MFQKAPVYRYKAGQEIIGEVIANSDILPNKSGSLTDVDLVLNDGSIILVSFPKNQTPSYGSLITAKVMFNCLHHEDPRQLPPIVIPVKLEAPPLTIEGTCEEISVRRPSRLRSWVEKLVP